MTPGPGIKPGTHWWEASALTTAPSLLSQCTLPELEPGLLDLEKITLTMRPLRLTYYKQYHLKTLLDSFHLNSHTLGFHLQT